MSYTIRQPRRHYHFPHEAVYVDSMQATHEGLIAMMSQAIWLTTSLIIELLSVRFMIAYLEANPSNPFFHFIYASSQPIVTPFLNLFNNTIPNGNFYRFEAYTLVAIAFYALIGYGIARLLTTSEPDLDID